MRLLHLVDIDSDINYTFHWWVSFVCGNSAACLLFKFAVNLRFLEPTEKPNTFFSKRQKSDRKISFV